MTSQQDVGATVSGRADDRFAPVAEVFADNFATRGETGAACAVYADGALVVDLWGGRASPDGAWDRDTTVGIYSTTKGLAAICVALLADRGQVDYGEPVARYWPEFAEGGKEAVTVAQLLSHQAGLAALDEPLSLATVADQDALGARLARQQPLWPPGSGHGYHAVTFGFYAGALVRRITGVSLGTFFRREVAEPLGAAAYIGAPAGLTTATTVQAGFGAAMLDRSRPIVQAIMTPGSVTSRAMFAIPELAAPGAMDSDGVRRLEIPSANGVADARSLAAIYAAFAGQRTDARLAPLCRPDTVGRATTTVVAGEDLVLFEHTAFAMGFMKPETSFFAISPNDASFGHPGSGGSIAFADPVAGVAVAYVTNTLMGSHTDPRSAEVIAAVYGCL